jgi:rhamnose utilization protein RhaD (predicted bifunctional aldolase and dehydrogenase)
MIAERAWPVLALEVVYVKVSGVVVLSTHPVGYVTLTMSCVESSEGLTAESLDEMVATASGASTEPEGRRVPVNTCV